MRLREELSPGAPRVRQTFCKIIKKVSLTYSNHRLATDNVWDTGIALQYMYVDMVKGRHVT